MAFDRFGAERVLDSKMVRTGIDVLDQQGLFFPKNSLILLIGDPGSGFDVFLHQLLVARHQQGSEIHYISLDRPRSEILYDLSAYRWEADGSMWNFSDLSPSAKKDSTILSWETDPVNVLTHELIRTVQATKDRAEAEGRDVLLDTAINSISALLLEASLPSILGFINEYSAAIKDTSGLHFMTCVKGVHGVETEKILSHYSDCVLEFTTQFQRERVSRALGVIKMRGVAIPPRAVLSLEFTSEGILPKTTTAIS
ncbi:MAG: RAD55 family ATPase [Candidatus Hodarchaeales archaeon]|jgi:KaiC/GvpD/RAD55 family RecA-like ATPase